MPTNRKDLARGTKTLVLDDGTGLTITSTGSYWRENAKEIESGIMVRKAELLKLHAELGESLRAEGVMAMNERPAPERRESCFYCEGPQLDEFECEHCGRVNRLPVEPKEPASRESVERADRIVRKIGLRPE